MFEIFKSIKSIGIWYHLPTWYFDPSAACWTGIKAPLTEAYNGMLAAPFEHVKVNSVMKGICVNTCESDDVYELAWTLGFSQLAEIRGYF